MLINADKKPSALMSALFPLKKHNADNGGITPTGLSALETRMVEPFSLYTYTKILFCVYREKECFLTDFLRFNGCFSLVLRGGVGVDVNPLGGVTC